MPAHPATRIDDAAAVDLLRRAVETESVSGREQRVAALLRDAMAKFARTAGVDAVGNAVATVGEGPLHVVFLGHIDTVPGAVPVRVAGGRLYGRGSVDAKGAFCAAVAAASRLSPAARRAITLTLVGAVEEEAPSSRGARHAVETLPAPDLVVIGEPSGWSAVTLGYKGRLVVACEASVANSHSAGADMTAAEIVVGCWQRIRDWADRESSGRGAAGAATPGDDGGGSDPGDAAGIFDRIQATLQDIESRNDGLTQSAAATVGLRLPPAWPPAKTMETLRRLPLPAGAHIDFRGAEEPYRGPRDTPLTRAFRVAIREAGGRPRTNVKTGTSDMNVVAPSWRVPMLAYGPGDSALDHRPDEHVEIEEYVRAVRVLARALELVAERAAAGGP